MTGFGRSELKSSHGLIRVEVKSTNHKILEVSLRIPSHLNEFEEAARRLVADRIRRGKITLSAQGPDPSSYSARLVLNEPLAREVADKIKRLKKMLGLKLGAVDEDFTLREVLHYPDVLTKDTSSEKNNLFFKNFGRAVILALENLKHSREQEGLALKKDFLNRIGEIRKGVRVIERRLPAIEKEFRKRLGQKTKKLLPEGIAPDRERLTLETAQYLKNSDISEEVTRLKSHLGTLEKTLGEDGEIGRKIDFIGQEMIREANTVGAKSSDVGIAGRVIEIKSAIEKIREQSQNVE